MLRWHIHYNLLLLRMLSFSSDLHWALMQRPDAQRKPGHDNTDEGSRARIAQHLPKPMYSFLCFLSYCFYPPLMIAGPIITFNSFASQRFSSEAQLAEIGPWKIMSYALRWLAALLCLEILTHTMYFNCIAVTRAWPALEQLGVNLSPLHYAEGSYFVLVFMWLKVSEWGRMLVPDIESDFESPPP